MRFTSLGSGSEGNCLIVQTQTTCIMIDCGLGWRELQRRLTLRGLSPDSIQAVFITHEHADHIGGIDKLASRYATPVYASFGTFNGAARITPRLPRLQPFDSHQASEIAVGDLYIQPYVVPHDAREPTQYIVRHNRTRLGILTDAGSITDHMRQQLQAVDGLILEFNHDEAMLMNGPYPPSLKHRVGGALGHLSNRQATELLSDLLHPDLKLLVAAHLSQKNNHPSLVEDCLSSTLPLRCQTIIATQSGGFDWVSLQ